MQEVLEGLVRRGVSKPKEPVVIRLFREDDSKLLRALQQHASPKRKHAFSKELELRARTLIRERGYKVWEDSPEARLEQRIAHILEEIAAQNAMSHSILKELLRDECYIDTQMIEIDRRTPNYSRYRWPELEKQRDKIMRIHEQRRQTKTTHARMMRELHDQLVYLMQRRRQVGG